MSSYFEQIWLVATPTYHCPGGADSPALTRVDGRPLRGKVVAATGNGAESIALVERHAPDVALMDVCIDGEMDGIDAARIIMDGFAVPVVFVTGSSDEATRARISELRDSQRILKPARSIDLVTAIRRACGVHADQA